MKVSKIKPNPSNPRLIKDDKFLKLVKSIHDFPEMMEKRPMVCVTDSDGLIYPLGGNMRLRAIQELKIKEIPDTWVTMADDWSEEKRNEFVIKDNVSFGEWDFDELANNWDAEELKEWGVDLPVWGNDAIDDIEEVEEFNEDCNFTIKCKNIEELEKLQTKLSTGAKKINYTEFVLKSGI